MSGTDRTILAIDAGSTASRCIVATLDGEVLGHGIGGPANHMLSGWEATRTSLQQSTWDALQNAGIRTEQIDVIVAGSAGIGPNGEGREPIEQALAQLVPGGARVRAIGDMVTAFWGALRTPIGVVVSSGIGSVCFGRNVTGETCQIGGWGSLMGDEGSAHDIGTQALRSIARSFDGRTEPTLLTDLLCRHFGATTPIEIARQLFAAPPSRDRLAGLAVHVSTAADRGDPVALHILRKAAHDLAIAAVAALRHLQLLDSPSAVSFSGSVFEAGRPLIDPFQRAMRDSSPHSVVETPLLPPIGGAFRLGLQTAGFTMDEPIIHRLAKGLLGAGL